MLSNGNHELVKTIYINCPGGEIKQSKLFEISKLIFNKENLCWIEYDMELSLKHSLKRLMEADYYVSVEQLWQLNDDKRSCVDRMARELFDCCHRYELASIYLYSKDEWEMLTKDHVKLYVGNEEVTYG